LSRDEQLGFCLGAEPQCRIVEPGRRSAKGIDEMHMKPIVAIAASLVLLVSAGCSTGNYDVARTALQGSPGLRSQTISNCGRMIDRKPLATRRNMATVMNTSTKNVSRLYCQRIIRAIASGRLTRADIQAGARGQLTPNIVRVVQGR
jgi:hypothetical protein